jgi:hypothetical protein
MISLLDTPACGLADPNCSQHYVGRTTLDIRVAHD